MPRFICNRRWTFILVLVLSTAGVASLSRPGLADPAGQGGGKGIGDSGGGDITPSPGPDPQGAGDPDSPSGSGKTAPTSVGSGGSAYGRVGPLGGIGVGDAAAQRNARILLRIRLAMGMLKYYYLRF